MMTSVSDLNSTNNTLYRLSFRWALVVAVIAGMVLVAAFSPLDWWPVALISPAILIFLWLDASRRESFWIGYAFGAGFFGVGVSWVYNSIHVFGQAPAAFAMGLTLLFVMIISVYPGLVGWLQAFGSTSHRALRSARLLLLLPGLWVLSEWLRGWLFTGFPWLQLGYSQLDTPLAGFAPVLGVLGVSWVVMLLSGLIVLLLIGKGSTRAWSLGGLFLLVGLASGLNQLTWTVPVDNPLKVALIQGNIAQQNKWKEAWLLPTVNRYVNLTLENTDRDLVVWPEVALPGRYRLFKPNVLGPLARKLAPTNTRLILGALYEEGDELHNSVIRLGEETEVYHKRHLVPFGEYTPFREWLGWLEGMVILPADIAAGDEPRVLHAGDTVIASSVCYEDAYGREVSMMLPEANLLINVSNDAWFGDSLAAPQHLQIARMRSLELGRPQLRATNTGISAVIDFRGQVEKQSPQFEVDVLKASVLPRTGATPYVSWGSYPLVLLILGTFLVFTWRLKKAPG